MAKQDRAGSKYEKLLAFSLDNLGYDRNSVTTKNYLQPPKNAEIVIPGTYIQPDLVIRNGETVSAVLYATHWSNTRSSKYKYWRTWEEQAQQRCEIGDEFLSVNCVFEALPAGSQPMLVAKAEELPPDPTRENGRPLQLEGWDPGIGWALVESFDINLLFPKDYSPIAMVKDYVEGDHDDTTTRLLSSALRRKPKWYFSSQWSVVRSLKQQARKIRRGHPDTKSRYRIGLLHIYLLVRLAEFQSGRKLPLGRTIAGLGAAANSEIEVEKLHQIAPFDTFHTDELVDLLYALSGVFVRKGKKAQTFCSLKQISHKECRILRVAFNDDIRLCLSDLLAHLANPAFEGAIENSFSRFDKAFGVMEAIDDLASAQDVGAKTRFVEKNLLPYVTNPEVLSSHLMQYQFASSELRKKISTHVQNWHFELLLYLCGLNSAEDIQTRFKERFESRGHKLRPHAPYGDHAKTVAFMIQGRDVCEMWSETGRNRTLSKQEFRDLCWEVAAECVNSAIADHGPKTFRSTSEATTQYLQNKSMRIISSDLNGFNIMLEHFLGDLCHLQFLDDEDEESSNALKTRVCQSWQTDMVKSLWGAAPLETWVEGVSKDGKWLVKIQSAQDGNEGHKTKELSGRARAIHLDWVPGKDPTNRNDWKFSARTGPKMALVLDGDWSRSKKKNLYEAGWDWVGDVSELDDLRTIILGDQEEAV